MRYFKCFLFLFIIANGALAQRITDFKLTDAVTGNVFTLSEVKGAPAIVLVFSSVSCPFSKLYEDRIIALHQKFNPSNIVFAIINPHTGLDESESPAEMSKRAKLKGYAMPYLLDPDQTVTNMAGMTKIPEVLVITSGPTGYSIAYKGGIDNNAQSAQSVSMHYLENALQQILERKRPSPASTRAVGCNIKSLP